MQTPVSIRNVAVLLAAAITVWLVFSEGTITAILFAGFCFFLGSLLEVFQRRGQLDQRRLITFTVMYTLCIFTIIAIMLWRYRGVFLS